jgi:hypothetical protein
LPTKLIAHQLRISSRMAEHHRTAVIQKMQARATFPTSCGWRSMREISTAASGPRNRGRGIPGASPLMLVGTAPPKPSRYDSGARYAGRTF